jgi:hypothetical protein
MSSPIVIALAFSVPAALVVAGIAYGPRKVASTVPNLPTRAISAVENALAPAPTEWEHGWKTDRVIATRYNNPVMGWNIGFTFPLNSNDCDRAELGDFMEANGGGVFSGGGYPGAEMFVKFKSVTDKASATEKIKAILPGLSDLITRLGNGEKVTIAKPKPEYEWPNVAPPKAGQSYGSLSDGSHQYKVSEVSPGKWQWVVDTDAEEFIARMDAKRRALFNALTRRPLTDDELKEAAAYGSSLNIENNVSYYANEKQQELTRAFAVQQMLRAQALAPTK